jgi:hypothetical protein
MFTAPSHCSPTSAVPVTHTSTPTIAVLRDALPASLREAMFRFSSTPGIHLDLQRQRVLPHLSPPTPSEQQDCSTTCGSTCCN